MMAASRHLYRFCGVAGAGVALVTVVSQISNEEKELVSTAMAKSSEAEPSSFASSYVYVPHIRIPSRGEIRDRLRTQEFDVLVIGGGATGCGAALDSQTRGLRTALVERDDFAAGTSSRSTKLIHGGVRYLEQAVFKLDIGQYRLVQEALRERKAMLDMAPHLTNPLPILMPCYKWWEVPFYWAGLKFYDFVAGSRALLPARYLNRDEAIRTFPMINKTELKGSVVYYDGQMNDSRFCVSLAVTAASKGAAVANHTTVLSLTKNAEGKVTGALVRDNVDGSEFEIRARTVLNATGPFVDGVIQMDDPATDKVVMPSSGVHLILPNYYSPSKMGLIIPKTKDGRVVFLLPWLDKTIAGTTDEKTEITDLPRAKESEVDFILSSISEYLNVHVRRDDVHAVWSGIRPLARDMSAKDGNTAALSREHMIYTSGSGLVTISGGKWTTFRKMAEDAVDTVVKVGGLKAGPCKTETMPLVGAENWTTSFFVVIAQNFVRDKLSSGNRKVHLKGEMDTSIAKHLSASYGTRALMVAEIAQRDGLGKRLAHNFPVLEAEVVYSIQSEFAQTIVDFIGRRCRLAFLDSEAALRAVPRVADIMAQELGWSKAKKKEEIDRAHTFLSTMSIKSVRLE